MDANRWPRRTLQKDIMGHVPRERQGGREPTSCRGEMGQKPDETYLSYPAGKQMNTPNKALRPCWGSGGQAGGHGRRHLGCGGGAAEGRAAGVAPGQGGGRGSPRGGGGRGAPSGGG